MKRKYNPHQHQHQHPPPSYLAPPPPPPREYQPHTCHAPPVEYATHAYPVPSHASGYFSHFSYFCTLLYINIYILF